MLTSAYSLGFGQVALALVRLPWLWSGCLGLGQVALALVMLPGLWSGCLSFGQVQIVLALVRLPWLWSGCFGFVQVVLALVRKSQKETEEIFCFCFSHCSGQSFGPVFFLYGSRSSQKSEYGSGSSFYLTLSESLKSNLKLLNHSKIFWL